MKIRNYTYLERRGLMPGSIVWACNYKVTNSKESMKFIQKPIKGMLTCSNKELIHNELMESKETYSSYFVPFKKDGKNLAWSKAVGVDSRIYATTEEESKELYNEAIQNYIDMWSLKIEELKNELI